MGKRTQYREEAVPMTSSVPLKLPARQQKLFREVLTLLNGHELPYAVSGAFALREYTGICRYTKDLDVFLNAQHASQALRYLARRTWFYMRGSRSCLAGEGASQWLLCGLDHRDEQRRSGS